MTIDIQQNLEYLRGMGVLPILFQDKNTGGSIIWANGDSPEMVVCDDDKLFTLQSRVVKACHVQEDRVKHMAEVFTPRKICYGMCRHADGILREESHSDVEYLNMTVLELACGEAPFLVSRYDMTTGEMSVERFGLLDKKLQAIQIKDENEWSRQAIRAYQSVYGYEYQGDSLLIARVNLVCAFAEYFSLQFGHAPYMSDLEQIAEIVAANLWQMDGLTGMPPYCSDVICRKYDWRAGEWTGLSFDFVIGNPPYQEDNPRTRRQRPVYHEFMKRAYRISPRVSMITPARFLFRAGLTPVGWTDDMLRDVHLECIAFWRDSAEVFPDVDVKGGIAVTYRDTNRFPGPIWVFIPDDEMRSIYGKTRSVGADKNLSSIISRRGMYHYSSKFFSDDPGRKSRIARKTANMMMSNAFQLFPDVFQDAPGPGMIAIHGRDGGRRVTKYIQASYIEPNRFLSSWNVLVPKVNGNGQFGEILGQPFVAGPGEGHTDMYLSIGAFPSEAMAAACLKYLKTRFARALLGIYKTTQDNPADRWRAIPLQSFDAASGIDWSRSVDEIDGQLWGRYGFSDTERQFLKDNVVAMI